MQVNYDVHSTNQLTLRSDQMPMFVSFRDCNKEVARIDADGVFRVKVDPTDENTKLFIDSVNSILQGGIKLTKVEIDG